MNSFRFCISEYIYIYSFISRKIILLNIEFQVYRVFSFNTLKTLFHCNFFQRVMHVFLCYSVYNVFFYLATFMIYFLLLILINSIMVFLDVICFSFLVFEVHWDSWICWFIIFTKFGNSRLLFFQLFFFSYTFGDFSYTYIRPREVIPHLTDDLCIF